MATEEVEDMTAQGGIVLDEEWDAEAVWRSRSNDIRVPVKDHDAGPPTYEDLALGIWWSSRETLSSCVARVPTSWTESSGCVSRCLSAMLRLRGLCAEAETQRQPRLGRVWCCRSPKGLQRASRWRTDHWVLGAERCSKNSYVLGFLQLRRCTL